MKHNGGTMTLERVVLRSNPGLRWWSPRDPERTVVREPIQHEIALDGISGTRRWMRTYTCLWSRGDLSARGEKGHKKRDGITLFIRCVPSRLDLVLCLDLETDESRKVQHVLETGGRKERVSLVERTDPEKADSRELHGRVAVPKQRTEVDPDATGLE